MRNSATKTTNSNIVKNSSGKIIPIPKELIHTVQENENLLRYLESLLKGKPATDRSWLYENVAANTVKENWLSILDNLSSGSSFEKEVYQFDTSQLEKWGPQGGVKPISELMDIVKAGFSRAYSPTPNAFNSRLWAQAKDQTEKQLWQMGCYSLRPASYQHVVDDMRARDTLESNSGWPDFARRNLPEVKQHAIDDALSGAWKQYPAIALFRNYRQKTRLVWMFPMSANIVEGSYFQPLQSKIMEGRDNIYKYANSPSLAPWSFFAPWKGFSYVRDQITGIYNNYNNYNYKYISASDFSATDEHFIPRTTQEVGDVLERCFIRQNQDGLWESLRHMQTIPLVIGPDSMITGPHGVSSGSNWTNFIETIFDLILANYVEIITGEKYSGMYAIGDDMSWMSENYDDAFATILEQVGKDVGQEIKADKTTNEPDKVKTLQRLFQRGYNNPEHKCRGVYATTRALNSSIYPEKFHKPKLWNSDMFCARQYMILENCVDHPLFEEFVKFVVKGQKDLIPFARKPASELDRILRETKLLPGFNPTYNQERRDSSLAQFASIRYAATL